MEWKIGEIKQINAEWYQCLKSPDGGCKHCDMNFEGKCPIPIKECTESGRSDKSYVIFKKLEKVGEPIEFARGLYFQRYQLADSTAFYEEFIGGETSDDLMMLPEKKEGWINVYKERCYETKEEAIRHIAPGTHYIDTIRVEWEDKE